MSSPGTKRYLARAFELAAEAAGGVSPRPPVGAVIVADGEVVGEGKTEPRPGVHAEVAAVRAAGDRASGATMYCTLEPHAHQGVAPPCTEEIIAAGISTLVCPIEDPNPQVNGNGFRRLRSAGVEVITDVSPEVRHQAEEMVSGFRMLTLLGRPQFTLKYATSLDGRIATPDRESQWITGEEARVEAHRMRYTSDAIVTGIGTVLKDNPRMTARNKDGTATGRPRLRIVLDARRRMPVESALLSEPGDVLWVVGEDADTSQPAGQVEVMSLPGSDGHTDLNALAKLLGERGFCDVLVEAGSTLAGAFVESGLVDRVAAFVGPMIIGGEGSPGPVGGIGPAKLADALKLESMTQRTVGDSILITARVVKDES